MADQARAKVGFFFWSTMAIGRPLGLVDPTFRCRAKHRMVMITAQGFALARSEVHILVHQVLSALRGKMSHTDKHAPAVLAGIA